MTNHYKPCTKADDEVIRGNWMTSTTEEIAKMLGRSPKAVADRANKIGYTKTMRKPEKHYVRFKR